MEISKKKAQQIIKERIGQITQATNIKEVQNYEYFAHGAANAMWELDIFTQAEHTENYDNITAVAKKRMGEF